MEYRVFTSNLANLEKYKRSLDRLKSDLDTLNYLESNVKGIDYTRIPTKGNPSVMAQKRLEQADKREELEREIDFTMMAITMTESILNRMPIELQGMLKDVFCYGMTYKSVGEKYGYSDNGLWHLLQRESEKYL